MCCIACPPPQVSMIHQEIIRKLEERFQSQGLNLIRGDSGPAVVVVVNNSCLAMDVKRDLATAGRVLIYMDYLMLHTLLQMWVVAGSYCWSSNPPGRWRRELIFRWMTWKILGSKKFVFSLLTQVFLEFIPASSTMTVLTLQVSFYEKWIIQYNLISLNTTYLILSNHKI